LSVLRKRWLNSCVIASANKAIQLSSLKETIVIPWRFYTGPSVFVGAAEVAGLYLEKESTC